MWRRGLLVVFLCLGMMLAFAASGYAYLGQYRFDNTDPTTNVNGYVCSQDAQTYSSKVLTAPTDP